MKTIFRGFDHSRRIETSALDILRTDRDMPGFVLDGGRARPARRWLLGNGGAGDVETIDDAAELARFLIDRCIREQRHEPEPPGGEIRLVRVTR